MRSISSLLILGLLALATSCSEQSQPRLVLPSDLQVTVALSQDVEGLVDVVASARNANYYSFQFQDGADAKEVESATGTASYTFQRSGIHQIRVRAHVTTVEFIEVLDTVSIALSGGPDSSGIPTTGYSTPSSYPNMSLVWRDEFDGNALNLQDWSYELGTGQNGWGNNELQYYRKENTSVGNGVLTIEARQELAGTKNYTSSRLVTRGKQSFKYGRVDIRAALPYGKGMWPALWMLGESISSVGWPRCGEIDIMEMVGGASGEYSDSRVHGTAHWALPSGERALFGDFTELSTGTFADEFHVFSIIWDSDQIQWLLDDVPYHVLDIRPDDLSEFRDHFFFVFNVAVGGNWPGPPNGETRFPQRMYVDYIRVFQ